MRLVGSGTEFKMNDWAILSIGRVAFLLPVFEKIEHPGWGSITKSPVWIKCLSDKSNQGISYDSKCIN